MSQLALGNSAIHSFVAKRRRLELKLRSLIRQIDQTIYDLTLSPLQTTPSGLAEIWLRQPSHLIKTAASWWPSGRRELSQFIINVASRLKTAPGAWKIAAAATQPKIIYNLVAHDIDNNHLGHVMIGISDPDVLRTLNVQVQEISALSEQHCITAQVYFSPKLVQGAASERSSIVFKSACAVFSAQFHFSAKDNKAQIYLEDKMNDPQPQIELSLCVGEIELPIATLLQLRSGDQLELDLPKRLQVSLNHQHDQIVTGFLEFTSAGARLSVEKSCRDRKLSHEMID